MRWVAAAFAIFSLIAYSQDLPKPIRDPVPPSDSEKAAIQEGVALHDAGQYEEAIKKYQEVLHQNPNCVQAMHELSFSCYTVKNYTCAMQAAQTGAEFNAPELPMFYMLMANVYDDTGESEKANKVYRVAIERAPKSSILHFNYGVNMLREHKLGEARNELETALTLNPNHPGSHLMLGRAYEDSGYRVPAILAYSRFLALEPSSQRSAATLKRLQSLVMHDVSAGEKPGNINITLSADSPKDEGDFTAAELAIAIGVAASTTEKEKDKTPFENLASTYLVLGEVIGNAKGGFAATFYAPFFKRLHDRKLSEAFVAYAWRSAKLNGTEEWSDKNAGKIAELQECCIKN